jgi:hypothetical protein
MKTKREKIRKIAESLRYKLDYDDVPKANCLPWSRKLVNILRRAGFSAHVIRGTFGVDSPDPGAYSDWDVEDFESADVMEGAMYNPLHYWVACGRYWVDISADQFNEEIESECDHQEKVIVDLPTEFQRHKKS